MSGTNEKSDTGEPPLPPVPPEAPPPAAPAPARLPASGEMVAIPVLLLVPAAAFAPAATNVPANANTGDEAGCIPAGAGGAAAKPAAAVSSVRRFFRNLGGTSLAVSIALHALVVLAAVFWTISALVRAPDKAEPETFTTGAGGGVRGPRPRVTEHRISPPKPRDSARTRPKLAVRGASALSVADLAMPDAGLLTAPARGGLSKGFGAGAGGGAGAGLGIGAGGTRNLAGKFVMGVRVRAQKIAVYLDCSGSMVPFLERVKAEIRAQFPDADIYEVNGIATRIRGNRIVGGFDGGEGGRAASRGRRHGTGGGSTQVERLSEQGRKIFTRYAANFERGSVGAWTDIMMREDYGALVVFSDFQDGITGDDPEPPDGVKTWRHRWTEHFAKAATGGAPRLYLFSIQRRPQDIWQQCVRASGGEIKMMPELRQRRRASVNPSANPPPATHGKRGKSAE